MTVVVGPQGSWPYFAGGAAERNECSRALSQARPCAGPLAMGDAPSRRGGRALEEESRQGGRLLGGMSTSPQEPTQVARALGLRGAMSQPVRGLSKETLL